MTVRYHSITLTVDDVSTGCNVGVATCRRVLSISAGASSETINYRCEVHGLELQSQYVDRFYNDYNAHLKCCRCNCS